MGTITVTCPLTGKMISTETFAHLPQIEAAVDCPHCGEKHFWTRNEAVCARRKVSRPLRRSFRAGRL
jgi:hypothetical protein